MAQAKDSYRVVGNSVPELVRHLDFLFQRVADRMDKIEGIRGTAAISSDLDMTSHKITSLGGGSASSDSARIADIPDPQSNPTFQTITLNGDATFNGDVKVYDADGTLIHSME